MANDIALTDTEIDLLREACEARGGVVNVKAGHGDLQARFARTVSASHLAKLGYFEQAGGDGWRIKPALKGQVRAVLREHG
jgi:hypothetical protein